MRKSVKVALATSALAVVGGLFLAGSSLAERGPGFGPGGPMGEARKLVKEFDKNGDGKLDETERAALMDVLRLMMR